MKVFFIILPISALLFISCFSRGASKGNNAENNKQQTRAAVLGISLKSGEGITFNVFDGYNRQIHVKNTGNKDSVVKMELAIDKPLQLVYRNILVLPEGPLFRNYSLLLTRGDTVMLKREEDGGLSMQYSSGYPNFVDSLISEPKSHQEMDQQQKQLKTIGLNGMVKKIETSFKNNEAAISNLNMSETRINILQKLNGNVKYTAIAHLLADPEVASSKLTDSLYDDLYQHLDEIRSIDALNNGMIYGAVIAYNAKKRNKNLDKKAIWACAAEADPQLKQMDIYKQFLSAYVINNFLFEPKTIAETNKELEAIHTQDAYLDTLYQLTTILAKTFTDFGQAKKALKTFADGRFSFIIENDEASANHEMKTINALPLVKLYDFAGNESDFKHIVRNKNYKLTLIDLWASWCVPCIAEIPHLKKIEDKFKGESIQFVTISIDKEKDMDKWIAAAKKNGIFDKPNQYRLANFKESPLTRLLNIRNIPRYVIINKEGKVLDDDFYRPSESKFELELLKYLN